MRFVCALAIVIAASLWHAASLRTIFQPGGDMTGWTAETFDQGTVQAPGKVDVEGFHPCADGWCLRPGKTGRLVYRFPTQTANPQLNVWFYRPEQGTSQLSAWTDASQRHQKLSENQRLVNTRIDLGIPVGAGQEVVLTFDAHNAGVNEVLVVDQCNVTYLAYPPARLPPARTAAWIVVSFGLAAVAMCRRRALALSTVLILALAAYLRYDATVTLANSLLDPDAMMYLSYARLMQPFTETGFYSARFGVREPLYIFVAWVYGTLFGHSSFGLRMLTVVLSVVAVWSVLRVGRLLFGAVPGQLIGLAIAFNGPLVAESPRGLRLELEIVLAMAYFTLAFLTPWKRVQVSAIATSLTGLLLALTRSTFVPVVLALNAYALLTAIVSRGGSWRDAISWRAAGSWAMGMAMTVAILVAGIAPYRYQMYKMHGNAFYDTAIYARWCANAEFLGQPGFPTVEELRKDGAAGPPITYGEYMFGMHTPRQLAEGTVRGYDKLFRHMQISPWWPGMNLRVNAVANGTFQVMAVVGFVAAAFLSRYRWIPLAFLLMEFPVAFLFDRNLVELYRHSYSAFPLVLFAAALPPFLLWTRLARVESARPEKEELIAAVPPSFTTSATASVQRFRCTGQGVRSFL